MGEDDRLNISRRAVRHAALTNSPEHRAFWRASYDKSQRQPSKTKQCENSSLDLERGRMQESMRQVRIPIVLLKSSLDGQHKRADQCDLKSV